MKDAISRLQNRRRLRFEPLESRRVLSITVNTLVDENNGVGVGAGTSLREAIAAAPPGDTINFSVTGTINLTVGPSNSEKHLVINKSLTISGPGQDLLTIRAFDPTPGVWNADGSGVFLIDDGNQAIDRNVTISGVTLTGGDVVLYGGAIQSRENLNLVSSTVSGNFSANIGGGIWEYEANLSLVSSTITGNGARVGGGVHVTYGDLSINSSKIQSNTATHGSVTFPAIIPCDVGGVSLAWGTLTITGSTIANNDSHGDVGGISINFGTANIASSTISGNRALGDDLNGTIDFFGGHAGGILSTYTNLNIRDTTISNNTARLDDGGLSLRQGRGAVITGSTITGNRADASAIGGGSGGGISVDENSSLTLDGSIVAGNLRGNSTRDDIVGAVTARYSLVGDGTGAAINSLVGNSIGTGATPINPLLGPLADNGGPTLTHALLGGSLAIDAGDPTASGGNDQRGAPFLRIVDGDGVSGARVDMGAFEAQPNQPRGDYNRNGLVDAGDYVLWRKTRSTIGLPAFGGADGSGNGSVGTEDHDVWRAHYGQTGGAASGASLEGEGGHAVIQRQALPALELLSENVPTDVRETFAILKDVRVISPADSAAGYSAGDVWLFRDDALMAWLTSGWCVREREPMASTAVESDSSEGDAVDNALSTLVGLDTFGQKTLDVL